MEVLINAKMDITLHLLVYWVRWEGDNRRRSVSRFQMAGLRSRLSYRARSSLFSTLNSPDRDSLIAELWENKRRREPDPSSADDLHQRMPSQNTSNDSSAVASTFASSHYTNETNSDTSPTSSVPSKSSLLKRLARHLTTSSRRTFFFKKPAVKTQSEPVLLRDPEKESQPLKSPALPSSREMSRSKTARSTTSSVNGSLSGSYQVLGAPRISLLNLTGASQPSLHSNGTETPMSATLRKRASWSAGPTKSAKGGIIREWEGLRSNDDDVLWQSEGDVNGRNREQRSLGRKLLFAQLKAIIPANSQRDIEHEEAVIGMLVSRWTGLTGLGEKMPWDSPNPAPIEVGNGNMEMKFHFRSVSTH
jgi:hypothetical protein